MRTAMPDRSPAIPEGPFLPETILAADAPDYQRVDLGPVDHGHARTVGAEHVVYETIKELGLQEKLRDLGFNKPAIDAAIGVIAARLIAPGSERSAHVWLQDVTALDDLLGADFVNLSRDRVYKTADMLLRRRSEIEAHLRGREQSLFQLRETLILYDLTNTLRGRSTFPHPWRWSRSGRTNAG